MEVVSQWSKLEGNVSDESYADYLERLQANFHSNASVAGKLFTTDTPKLWEVYLSQFPLETRQSHNCNACRKFIEHYGGLVMIDENGRTHSPLWNLSETPDEYQSPVGRMLDYVLNAKVTGVFVSSLTAYGESKTGNWRHMAVKPPKKLVFHDRLTAPHQQVAIYAHRLESVKTAIADFSAEVVNKCVTFFENDALMRSEKFLGPTKFLQAIYEDIARIRNHRERSNLLWLRVASAPEGYCHPRSSVIGTLLTDLRDGMAFDKAAERFTKMVDPRHYQRAQAAPSQGNIEQAEKIVAKLGIVESLRRRYARLEEVQKIWTPKKLPERDTGGVFAALRDAPKPANDVVKNGKITWRKFADTVLPNATNLELYAAPVGAYGAFITAAVADAPPIVKWDLEDARNPFSHFTIYNGSAPSAWGLARDRYYPVAAVSLQPNLWQLGYEFYGEGVMLVVEEAKFQRDAALCLFPEMLKQDLHSVRSTIEAFSNKGKLEGRAEATACGWLIQKESNFSTYVRATSGGVVFEYEIDRWE